MYSYTIIRSENFASKYCKRNKSIFVSKVRKCAITLIGIYT